MRELPVGNDRPTSKSNAADARKKQKGGIAQLARASALQAEGRRFDSDYLHKRKKTSNRMSFFFCGDAPLCGALLCLGALPLLYPAAPPSVFAFGKYTAPAVALGREYVVGFWVVMVWIYLDERRRVALLGPHRVWGLSFWRCLWIFNPLAERLTAAAIYA